MNLSDDVILIPENYQVLITYSPISEMTGHMREAWDYYFLLKKYFKTAILFHTPTLNLDYILDNSLSEYEVSEQEYEEIKNDIFHSDKEKHLIVSPSAICLLCDGNIRSLTNRHIKIISKKIICFKCADYNFDELYFDYKNILFLQDYRIYGNKSIFNIIDYRKKFNFNKYKKIDKNKIKNRFMFYLTENCRYQTESVINDIIEYFGSKNEFLILTPKKDLFKELINKYSTVTVSIPPIKNFHLNFNTYIYTPVPRHFDCSPRIITECAFYNKKVEYFNIDYYDIGLETRRYDIEHDFESLILKDDDKIIKIIEENLD